MSRSAVVRTALVALLILTATVLLVPRPARAATSARVLSSVTTGKKVVALTFDDGPSPYTPAILAVLKRYRAHATFFVVGSQVTRYPHYARDERLAGDEIGNHTYTHADLEYLTDAGIAQQIQATDEAVKSAAGVVPEWLRPPYGAVDSRVAAVVAGLGLQPILWSVDPRDWSLPGTATIIDRVLGAAQPGSVVIMHDGGGDRSETVAALSAILASLSARGYQFLTLTQLFASAGPCDLQHALRRFAARGIHPHPAHAIFEEWENLYCAGTDLGPATSREERYRRGLVRQDFALTGHRIVWNLRADTARVTQVWPWAVDVFGAAHILPAWHTPITSAWFTQFFDGRDWGPAESQVYTAPWGQWQRFRYGSAVQRGRDVVWHRPAPKTQWR